MEPEWYASLTRTVLIHECTHAWLHRIEATLDVVAGAMAWVGRAFKVGPRLCIRRTLLRSLLIVSTVLKSLLDFKCPVEIPVELRIEIPFGFQVPF